MAEDILRSHLGVDTGVGVPWKALHYLVSDATYGGRVTDEVDRRVLAGCIGRLFCNAALESPSFKLMALLTYCTPTDGSLASHCSHIAAMPMTDPPEALGQHANAELSHLIEDARALLDGLGAVAGCAGAVVDCDIFRDKREDAVASVAAELLETVRTLSIDVADTATLSWYRLPLTTWHPSSFSACRSRVRLMWRRSPDPRRPIQAPSTWSCCRRSSAAMCCWRACAATAQSSSSA